MSNKVNVTLLLCGVTKDLVNTANDRHELRASISEHWTDDIQLRDYICSELLPTLNEVKPTLALALNEEYICSRSDIRLKNDDIIALIPPITGG